MAMAYKGYLIMFNAFLSEWYVWKDGHHITTVHSEAEAKKAIDELTRK